MIKLRWYQKEMISYGLKTDHPIYFVEMRLGKTIPVIRLCKHWNRCVSVLIVAPYSAFMGWCDDLKKESEFPAVELSGPTNERASDLYNHWPVTKYFMISKEAFLYVPEVKDMPWDVVILDESTFIKNPKPKVTHFFINNFRDVKHRVIMTGLPAPDNELDYHQQLTFVNPDIIPMSYWQFRNKYFNEIGYDWTISKKGRIFLSQRLARYCYFMTRKEAGIGSEKIYETRLIAFPKKVKKVYETLRDEFIYELEDEFRVTKYATVKFNWMRKLLGGMFDGKKIWDGKCKEVKSLMTGELKNESLIIYCQYIEEILYVQQYFKKKFKIGIIYGAVSKKKREYLIKQFQLGELDWLVVQPVTVRYAVDFSRASVAIYYSMPGRETRYQSEDRLISAEINEPKLIIDLIVVGSCEEQLHKSYRLKEHNNSMMRKIIKQCKKEAA